MTIDIEQSYTGWLSIFQPMMMPKDEVVDAKIMAFHGKEHPDDGSYIVRVEKKTPTIEFVCANEKEAEELYQWFKASRKVVEIDFKKGTNK